jgi:isocitrate dehydrogenase
MTGDLARMANPAAKEVLDSWQFIDRIADRMR